MNFKAISKNLGRIMYVEGAFLLTALPFALYNKEKAPALAFILTAALCGLLGFVLTQREEGKYFTREGYVTVGIGWLLVSAMGALPFYISRAIPSYIDAFFETVSGFTTTGASILTEIESLPMSILYWRSFTHWLGGMGVLVFLLAFSVGRKDSGDSLYLLQAESPGVNVGKMVPRMRHNSAWLYGIYIALTLMMFVLLVFDMPFFDALTTALATAGTGGFAIKNDSMTSYSLYSQIVTTVFMFVFGINFTAFYYLACRRLKDAFKMQEVRWYIVIAVGSAVIIALNIWHIFGTFGMALHQAFFAVGTVMSTTGFGINDFDLWPELSRTMLLGLMFVGACTGSTGGGLKVMRIVVIFKAARRRIRRTLHPGEVQVLRMDDNTLSEETVDSISGYLLVFVVVTAAVVLALSLDGQDFVTTFSAVAACINNIGPGLSRVGPAGNYAFFSPWAKLLLSWTMLVGRLELYPMLALLSRHTWKK